MLEFIYQMGGRGDRTMNLSEYITEHFTLGEMLRSAAASRLGLDNTPESDEIYENIKKTCEALEIVRAYYGKPINVLSCYRAPEVNQAVGGSKSSAHMKGLAADFTIAGIPNIEICSAISALGIAFDQIIYEFGESGWVHLGLTNGTPRHQILSAIKQNGKTVYKVGLTDPD